MLIDVNDASTITLDGNVGLGMLQIEDGSQVVINPLPPKTWNESNFQDDRKAAYSGAKNDTNVLLEMKRVVVIQNSLIIDGNSILNIKGKKNKMNPKCFSEELTNSN